MKLPLSVSAGTEVCILDADGACFAHDLDDSAAARELVALANGCDRIAKALGEAAAELAGAAVHLRDLGRDDLADGLYGHASLALGALDLLDPAPEPGDGDDPFDRLDQPPTTTVDGDATGAEPERT